MVIIYIVLLLISLWMLLISGWVCVGFDFEDGEIGWLVVLLGVVVMVIVGDMVLLID